MANTVVNQIIEVNGVIFTQTRPGYYYKKQDGKQTRISKDEWEKALSEWTDKLGNNLDKLVEKKSAKKTRRSKDVAFEFQGVTLTKKQVSFLKEMPNDENWDNGVFSTLWTDIFCDTVADKFSPMAVGAMISTLREKNVLSVTISRVDGKKCKNMTLTDLGQEIARQLGLE